MGTYDSSSLTHYYQLICKQPLLSDEEEKALIAIIFDKTDKYGAGQKKRATDKLINANLRFVFKKAKQRARGDIDMFNELIAAGNDGLLIGLEKFDPSSGVKFLSYAGWWVMQRQLKEQSKMRIVALPVWKQQLAAKIERYQETLGRLPTTEELKTAFPEYKEKDLKELVNTKYLTYYIDDFLNEDNFINELEDILIDSIDKEYLEDAINKLTSPTREVIELTFGFDDGKEKKLSAVAKDMGLKREEIRKLRQEGLIKLKKFLEERTKEKA